MIYIEGDKPKDETGCPFCLSLTKRDEGGLIIARGEYTPMVMNPSPYSPGHLLACPYHHVSGYVDATADETHEMAELAQQVIAALVEIPQPAGFNIGINQRIVAGAGIAAYLH